APRSKWGEERSMADPARPGSALYVSLLTRATGAASAITAASSALQRQFGGTLLPHGALTDLFDPEQADRESARRQFGFTGATVLFPGPPRAHKGIEPLAEAVGRVPGARLAIV